MERPGAEPGQVEQLIDELRLDFRVSLNRLGSARRLLVPHVSAREQVGPPEDRIEGCSQLVRDGREQGLLGVIGPLGIGSCHPLTAEEVDPLGGQRFLGGPVTQDRRVPPKLLIAIPQRRQQAAHPEPATILADLPPLVLGSPRHPCPIECVLSRRLIVSRKQAISP